MKRRARLLAPLLAALAALAALATACVSAPAVPPAAVNPPPSSLPAALTAAIGADAAQRTGRPIEQIHWQTAEPVTWSDGSLGCPQPGRMYTQALVPGWRIVLQAAEQTLHYHAGNRGGWVFCPAERRQTPRPDSRM